MKRGFEAVLADLDALAASRRGNAVHGRRQNAGDEGRRRLGPALRNAVHAARQELADGVDAAGLRACCKAAVEAVAARASRSPGRRRCSTSCCRSRAELRRRPGCRRVCEQVRRPRTGDHSDGSAARARFVPEGALDRAHGSRCALQPIDDRGRLRRAGVHTMNVGIVIVSHSPEVAKGAADMVRQMVGDGVPLAWTGGNPDGGLGTIVEGILAGDRCGVVGRRRRDPRRSRRRGDQQRNGDRDAAG